LEKAEVTAATVNARRAELPQPRELPQNCYRKRCGSNLTDILNAVLRSRVRKNPKRLIK